jgi:hypothetical protein
MRKSHRRRLSGRATPSSETYHITYQKGRSERRQAQKYGTRSPSLTAEIRDPLEDCITIARAGGHVEHVCPSEYGEDDYLLEQHQRCTLCPTPHPPAPNTTTQAFDIPMADFDPTTASSSPLTSLPSSPSPSQPTPAEDPITTIRSFLVTARGADVTVPELLAFPLPRRLPSGSPSPPDWLSHDPPNMAVQHISELPVPPEDVYNRIVDLARTSNRWQSFRHPAHPSILYPIGIVPLFPDADTILRKVTSLKSCRTWIHTAGLKWHPVLRNQLLAELDRTCPFQALDGVHSTNSTSLGHLTALMLSHKWLDSDCLDAASDVMREEFGLPNVYWADGQFSDWFSHSNGVPGDVGDLAATYLLNCAQDIRSHGYGFVKFGVLNHWLGMAVDVERRTAFLVDPQNRVDVAFRDLEPKILGWLQLVTAGTWSFDHHTWTTFRQTDDYSCGDGIIYAFYRLAVFIRDGSYKNALPLRASDASACRAIFWLKSMQQHRGQLVSVIVVMVV